jgi:hypothetical protein
MYTRSFEASLAKTHISGPVHLRCRVANGSKYHIGRSDTSAAAKWQIIANTLTQATKRQNPQCRTDRRAVRNDICTLVSAAAEDAYLLGCDAVSVNGSLRLERS